MKHTIKYLQVVLALFLVIFISACEGDDITESRLRVEMKATSSSLVASNGRTMETEIEFTEILIGVTEIELEFEDEDYDDSDDSDYDDGDDDIDDDDDEIEFEGEFVIDLLNGTSTPDFGIATIIPGIYEEIEIEMEPILENGTTLFVAFNFTNADGETINIEYSTDDELEFEIENEAGFQIEEDALSQILILVDMDKLFNGVDFNSTEADEDGVIRINKGSNAAIAAKIASNLDDILEAGDDDDDDDEFDDD